MIVISTILLCLGVNLIRGTLVDMTHDTTEDTIVLPVIEPFKMDPTFKGFPNPGLTTTW